MSAFSNDKLIKYNNIELINELFKKNEPELTKKFINRFIRKLINLFSKDRIQLYNNAKRFEQFPGSAYLEKNAEKFDYACKMLDGLYQIQNCINDIIRNEATLIFKHNRAEKALNKQYCELGKLFYNSNHNNDVDNIKEIRSRIPPCMLNIAKTKKDIELFDINDKLKKIFDEFMNSSLYKSIIKYGL